MADDTVTGEAVPPLVDGTEAPSDDAPKDTTLLSYPPNPEEQQYLDLVRQILDTGEHRPDRTGTGTFALFAPRPLKFALHRAAPERAAGWEAVLPLLTTKRVFFRAVLEELLWFIRGETSSATLSARGVKIWDGNGSREFLDRQGFTDRAEGDLGPVYGFQWRHFGAAYRGPDADYTGQGVDQLADVVRKLRTTPHDRRIVLSAWNPRDLGLMVLPPCHMFAQFYVGTAGAAGTGGMTTTATTMTTEPAGTAGTSSTSEPPRYLHCQLYQRSCDMGLGVPFNIASYALLTHMLAHVCGLVPGSLTHVLGDAHVYADHVDALRVQLAREPRPFPTLALRPAPGGSIDGWQADDFVVEGYAPHKALPMKMSV